MKKYIHFIMALLIILFYIPSIADPSPNGEQLTLPALEVAPQPVTSPVLSLMSQETMLDSHLPSIYLPDDLSSTSYHIRYAKNNAHPGPSLKNAHLSIQVFKYSYPDGFRTVITDAEQRFRLDDVLIPSLTIEVISIQGQRKQALKCFGGSLPGKLEVVIKCQQGS